MSESLQTIYSTNSLAEAYILKQLLHDANILAVILNEHATMQGEGGAAAEVAVAAKDATDAREVAQFFEQHRQDRARQRGPRPAREDHAADAQAAAPPPGWPQCPACGRQRVTSCPYCQRTGSVWPAAFGRPAGEKAGNPLAPFVVCPTCDEPFVARFYNQCPWCNHHFPDGVEAPRDSLARRLGMSISMTPPTTREWLILAVIVAAVTGLLTAFWFAAPN